MRPDLEEAFYRKHRGYFCSKAVIKRLVDSIFEEIKEDYPDEVGEVKRVSAAALPLLHVMAEGFVQKLLVLGNLNAVQVRKQMTVMPKDLHAVYLHNYAAHKFFICRNEDTMRIKRRLEGEGWNLASLDDF